LSKLQNPKNRCCDCCGDHADKLPPCLEPKRELGYEISFHLHMCYVVSRRECCWKTVDFCGRFEFETQLLRNRSSRSHRPGPLQYSRWCELKVPPTSQFSGRIYIDSTTEREVGRPQSTERQYGQPPDYAPRSPDRVEVGCYEYQPLPNM